MWTSWETWYHTAYNIVCLRLYENEKQSQITLIQLITSYRTENNIFTLKIGIIKWQLLLLLYMYLESICGTVFCAVFAWTTRNIFIRLRTIYFISCNFFNFMFLGFFSATKMLMVFCFSVSESWLVWVHDTERAETQKQSSINNNSYKQIKIGLCDITLHRFPF